MLTSQNITEIIIRNRKRKIKMLIRIIYQLEKLSYENDISVTSEYFIEANKIDAEYYILLYEQMQILSFELKMDLLTLYKLRRRILAKIIKRKAN